VTTPQQPEDPNEIARIIALTELANAEAGIFRQVWELLKEWAVKLKKKIFGAGTSAGPGPVDPLGVHATTTWFQLHLDDVLVEIEEAWTTGYEGGFTDQPEVIPDAWGAKQAAQQAYNRLVGVPDSVFTVIRTATLKATTEGWSADDLAAKVEEILGEHGQDSWRGRALAIARTEALAAYNGGKFQAFQAYAGSVGGSWEKVWLATHDHRTRFTHTGKGGGDLQRVPLLDNFVIGGAPLMYPGDPAGPPGEIINCRCSMLLVKPGEQVDMSDRQYRSAK
jgi:hypothetical protein